MFFHILLFHHLFISTTLNALKFLQFSDFHYEPNYESKCEGYLGNYACDSPLALVRSTIVQAKLIEPNPDFILYTGDTGPHRDTSRDELLLIEKEVRNLLFSQFNESIPVVFSLGNHDVHPDNLMSIDEGSVERLNWCSDLSLVWNRLTLEEMEQMRFKMFCYYATRIPAPSGNKTQLMILSVNGLIWYKPNTKATPPPGSTKDKYDPLGQFTWITAHCMQAREQGYKIILSSHFPPGASENAPTKYRHYNQFANPMFIKILQNYSDVILATLVAHTHVDSFRVVFDEYDVSKPIGTVHILPSVTTFHLSGLGAMNPRFRLYHTDSKVEQVADYEQYILDLAKPNKTWSLYYRASEVFGGTPLTADLMNKAVKKMQNSTDYMTAYWERELGGRPHDNFPNGCTKENGCQCQEICSIKYLDYDLLDKCLVDHGCFNIATRNRTGLKFLYAIIGIFLVGLFCSGLVYSYRKWTSSRRNRAKFEPNFPAGEQQAVNFMSKSGNNNLEIA